jgi:hypothetical protein
MSGSAEKSSEHRVESLTAGGGRNEALGIES